MKEKIIELLKDGRSYSEIIKEVGCAKSTISYHAKKLGLNKKTPPRYNWDEINKYYHSKDNITVLDCRNKFGFSSFSWTRSLNLGKVTKKNKEIPVEQLFTKDSIYSRNTIKRRILQDKLLEYKCQICSIFEWQDKELTLHLDHINGINNDHRLDNLRFLCPNCHTQTLTYSGRNKLRW